MSHEAQAKGQPEVPVYSVDELLHQAQEVGVEGVIDCGCELPDLMTAVDMAREHPGVVHAAIAIHPNESVLHGHRGVPGPDGLPLRYKPWHEVSFDDAIAEVERIARAYPRQVVAIGETGMDLFRTGEGAKELQREGKFSEVLDDAYIAKLKRSAPLHDIGKIAVSDLILNKPGKLTDEEFAIMKSQSYKGNDGIRESARIVGLDHVMVETDAPYLTPMPYRGRTNAPYMIPYTLDALAQYLALPIDEVACATRATTREVYGV